jgi:hypothetical protein
MTTEQQLPIDVPVYPHPYLIRFLEPPIGTPYGGFKYISSITGMKVNRRTDVNLSGVMAIAYSREMNRNYRPEDPFIQFRGERDVIYIVRRGQYITVHRKCGEETVVHVDQFYIKISRNLGPQMYRFARSKEFNNALIWNVERPASTPKDFNWTRYFGGKRPKKQRFMVPIHTSVSLSSIVVSSHIPEPIADPVHISASISDPDEDEFLLESDGDETEDPLEKEDVVLPAAEPDRVDDRVNLKRNRDVPDPRAQDDSAAVERARIAEFTQNDTKNCKSMKCLEDKPFTVIAKKYMLFRGKPRTVLLLREESICIYFAPDALFIDLINAQCPIVIAKIGQKTVAGKHIPVVVIGNAVSKTGLELGRPVEMHALKRNTLYSASVWSPRTWYKQDRMAFLVDGSSQVYLASDVLENVFKTSGGKRVQFKLTDLTVEVL